MVQYIVIGGGSAGCVIAARLSENTEASVVLLEEGPKDTNLLIHLPVGFYKTSQGNLVERYPWEPPADYIGPADPTMVQARVLGGGSSVNAMVYLRGQPADYDSWAACGAQAGPTRTYCPSSRSAKAMIDSATMPTVPTARSEYAINVIPTP